MNGTCSPTFLMVSQIQTPTPTATVTWQRRNTWSTTSLSLAQSLSFGTQKSASLKDTLELLGASNSLAHWTWGETAWLWRRLRAPWWPALSGWTSSCRATRWRHPNGWRDRANHCSRQPRAAYLAARSDAKVSHTATRRTKWVERLLATIPSSHRYIRLRRASSTSVAASPFAPEAWRWWLQQESDAEPQPPRRLQKSRRHTNPFIDVEICVEGDAIGDDGTEDENDDLNGFIVANDVEF